jgi:xanthine dehydrogenase accessory factor
MQIGDRVREGQAIARVAEQVIFSPFSGVIRGLVQGGLVVRAGEKIGDVDPRDDPRLCWLVSDKALSVGGGVLEAILSWKQLRQEMWS